ncbi:MAG: hypothetical protein VKM98_03480 [Cyanobacteriota bacterium]|nr:hypothetical protein [Cyanobacteriota bacterium]
MAALIAMVTVALAVAFWLMSPLSAALTPLLELRPLPWLLLLLGAWLLAGRPSGNG